MTLKEYYDKFIYNAIHVWASSVLVIIAYSMKINVLVLLVSLICLGYIKTMLGEKQEVLCTAVGVILGCVILRVMI